MAKIVRQVHLFLSLADMKLVTLACVSLPGHLGPHVGSRTQLNSPGEGGAS